MEEITQHKISYKPGSEQITNHIVQDLRSSREGYMKIESISSSNKNSNIFRKALNIITNAPQDNSKEIPRPDMSTIEKTSIGDSSKLTIVILLSNGRSEIYKISEYKKGDIIDISKYYTEKGERLSIYLQLNTEIDHIDLIPLQNNDNTITKLYIFPKELEYIVNTMIDVKYSKGNKLEPEYLCEDAEYIKQIKQKQNMVVKTNPDTPEQDVPKIKETTIEKVREEIQKEKEIKEKEIKKSPKNNNTVKLKEVFESIRIPPKTRNENRMTTEMELREPENDPTQIIPPKITAENQPTGLLERFKNKFFKKNN